MDGPLTVAAARRHRRPQEVRMRLTTRIGIGLATALLALATTGDAKAQGYYGGYGYGTPYYGVRPGYGYGTGYGYNRGYYGPQMYYVPQTYNNLNGLAGMIGRTVAPRSSYYGTGYRRRR
jgi:hypothetical protein